VASSKARFQSLGVGQDAQPLQLDVGQALLELLAHTIPHDVVAFALFLG